MHYVLLYDVVEDFINRRTPYREAHLKLIKEAHQRGELLMAGAFSDPVDGAALVFKADDPSVPRRFAQEDPYVQNGLIKDWRVRAWTVVIGS
jgi:uncharacterized protein YciI